MIKPEELEALPEDLEGQIRAIEQVAIEQTVRDMNDPEILFAVLAILKRSNEIQKATDILTAKALKSARRRVEETIRTAYTAEIEKAVRAGKNASESVRGLTIMREGIEETMNRLQNLTRTMGFHDAAGRIQPIGRIYVEKMNEAALHVNSGVMTHREAVKRVCTQLAEKGLYTVDYASGIKTRMDTAAARAIRTGVNQMAARMTESLIDELQADYVETTAHLGARPDHQVWQGQVFSLHGDGKYPDFVESTGYGEVTGLCGANCRHNFFIYWPGSSERAYSDDELANMNPTVTADGEEMTYYDATQKQRAMERAMRKSRRKIAAYEAGGCDEEAAASRARYSDQRKRYSDFSRQVGIRAKFERVY